MHGFFRCHPERSEAPAERSRKPAPERSRRGPRVPDSRRRPEKHFSSCPPRTWTRIKARPCRFGSTLQACRPATKIRRT